MLARLKSWLFIVSVLAVIVGPLAVSNVNSRLDAHYQSTPITVENNALMSQDSSEMSEMHIQRRWLGTWWLTLIGAGYAGLSAVVGAFDKRRNSPFGWIILVIAVLLYLLSIFGHFTQVNALHQGTLEGQAMLWSVVNGIMIFTWLIFFVLNYFALLGKYSHQIPLGLTK